MSAARRTPSSVPGVSHRGDEVPAAHRTLPGLASERDAATVAMSPDRCRDTSASRRRPWQLAIQQIVRVSSSDANRWQWLSTHISVGICGKLDLGEQRHGRPELRALGNLDPTPCRVAAPTCRARGCPERASMWPAGTERIRLQARRLPAARCRASFRCGPYRSWPSSTAHAPTGTDWSPAPR